MTAEKTCWFYKTGNCELASCKKGSVPSTKKLRLLYGGPLNKYFILFFCVSCYGGNRNIICKSFNCLTVIVHDDKLADSGVLIIGSPFWWSLITILVVRGQRCAKRHLAVAISAQRKHFIFITSSHIQLRSRDHMEIVKSCV